MKTLMVSPYAPYRDGIANYAVQEVAALQRSGEEVEILSPVPSAAHHHHALGSPLGIAHLLRRASGYDRIVIQTYPELLFGRCRTRVERAMVWLLLSALGRRTPTELRVHEIDYATLGGDPMTERAARRALASVERITVHTNAERDALRQAIGDHAIAPVELIAHGKDFVARTAVDRSEARRSLDVPEDAFVFLSIGFVQRHKGFDRAVRALGRIDSDRARLYVVGDVRIDHPDVITYRDQLDRLIATTPGAERRAGYVSDEAFDRWLVAADRLVLPYREIWSSSVIERAALFDLPVIVSRVGGLADQSKGDTVVVDDDDALAQAMAEAAGARLVEPRTTGEDDTREGIEALIRRRAGTQHADEPIQPSDHVRRIGYAVVGNTQSARPGVAYVKRAIQRLTAWEIEPTATTVNELRDATIRAIDELDGR